MRLMLDLYDVNRSEAPDELAEWLPGDEHEALRLVLLEDRSYSEAAGALDVTEGEVQARLLRAHRRLRVMPDAAVLD